MKVYLSIFILSIPAFLFGQSGDLNKVKIDSRFTWPNSTIIEQDSFYFDLHSVKNSSYISHIRISLTGQIIDLFSDDNKHFQGILINHIDQYKKVRKDWGESHEAFKIVYQIYELDPVISSSVANQILQSGQDSIPTDSLIASWSKSFFHCGSIEYQFKLGERYFYQS